MDSDPSSSSVKQSSKQKKKLFNFGKSSRASANKSNINNSTLNNNSNDYSMEDNNLTPDSSENRISDENYHETSFSEPPPAEYNEPQQQFEIPENNASLEDEDKDEALLVGFGGRNKREDFDAEEENKSSLMEKVLDTGKEAMIEAGRDAMGAIKSAVIESLDVQHDNLLNELEDQNGAGAADPEGEGEEDFLLEETLEELGEKLKEVAESNKERLASIYAKRYKQEIIAFSYDISCELSKETAATTEAISEAGEAEQEHMPWKLNVSPVYRSLENGIQLWRYKGEELEIPDDDFNDHINFSIQDIQDIKRLNDQMLFVGMKYADLLADRPKTRSNLRKYLNNLKRLDTAITEINEYFFNIQDDASDEVLKGLLLIKEGFDLIQKKVKNTTLSLKAQDFVGHAPTDYIPLDVDKVHSFNSIALHLGVVNGVCVFSSSSKEESEKQIKLATGTELEIKISNLSQEKMNNEIVSTLQGHAGPYKVLCSYVYNELPYIVYGCYPESSVLQVWDVTNSCEVGTLQGGHSLDVFSLEAFMIEREPFLASGGYDKVINTWNLITMERVASFTAHESYIFAITSFKHHGIPFIASGGADGEIKLWNLSKNKLSGVLSNHKKYILALASYHDKKTPCLASAGGDAIINLWNLSNGDVITTLTDHTSIIRALETFQSQTYPCLASACDDFTIRIWNLSDYTLMTYIDDINSVICSLSIYKKDEQSFLAGGTQDGYVRIWTLN